MSEHTNACAGQVQRGGQLPLWMHRHAGVGVLWGNVLRALHVLCFPARKLLMVARCARRQEVLIVVLQISAFTSRHRTTPRSVHVRIAVSAIWTTALWKLALPAHRGTLVKQRASCPPARTNPALGHPM